MNGWYAMKRGWLDHEAFKPKGPWSRAEAWVWMVENAAFKATTIDIGGKPYTVPRGSLCFSERFLSTKFKWSRKALQTFLSQLEAHSVIEKTVAKTGTGTRSKRSQVRLCNYDKYQFDGTKTEPKQNQNSAKEEQGKQINTIPVGETEVSEPIKVSVLTTALWSSGVQYLKSCDIAEKQARSLIGRWRKGNSDVDILSAIEAAQKEGTHDPIPYITEALKGGSNGKRTSKSEDRMHAFIAGAIGTP